MDRLQSMRVFVKVADNGSFARAAAQLDLSAAVVTRHVAELESHLGVRLLNRTTRSLSLTGAGQAYLERCRQIIDEVEEADAMVSSASSEPKGVLRVVAPVSFTLRNLAPLMHRYQRQHPQVLVDLTLTDRPFDMVEEGYDVGIVAAHMVQSETLITRLLSETCVLVCASPGYLAAHGKPNTPHDLAQHAMLGMPSEIFGNERIFTSADGEEIRIQLQNQFICNNTAMLRQSVLLGHGIAFLPSYLVGSDLKHGDMVALLPDYTLPTFDVNLVYPSRKHLSAKIRTFIDMTVECFRQADAKPRTDCWLAQREGGIAMPAAGEDWQQSVR